MRNLKVIAVCVVVGVVWFAVSGRAQNKTEPELIDTPRVGVNALMQAKLQSAQSIIKGLALEDFELIQREAQRLELLSLDTDWNILQTNEYARISKEFREAAKKLKTAGDEKNLDAAGLGYFRLTMTCIDCHRHVRAVKK
jgi:hypothetical protein